MSTIKNFWLLININYTELHGIIKNIFTLAAGGIVLRLIPFLVTPLILKQISPEEYGLIALIQSFISFIVIFSGLGLRQVLFINFFHCNSNQRKEIINNIIIIYLIFSLPILITCLSNVTIIKKYCLHNYANDAVIYLALIICFICFFSELYYQTLTLLGKTTKLILIQALIGLITGISNIVLVISYHLTTTGVFIGQLVGLLLVCFLGVGWYFAQSGYHYLNIRNAIKALPPYMAISLPFMPSMFFGWILSSSNRWFLAHYATLHDVGIYSIADAVGQLYQLIIMLPINNAYLPALLKKYSENKDALLSIERWNQKLMYLFLSSGVIIIVLISCSSQLLLPYILPIKYHEALLYIEIILLSYIFWTGTSFSLALVFFMKKIYVYLAALFISCLVNIGINFLLVPTCKINGCVAATLISYLIYFLISLACNQYVKNQISLEPHALLNCPKPT